MADFKVEGDPQRQLRKLAKDLKDAGEKDLRRALYRNINLAAKPLIADAKQEAAATLPKTGGAAQRVVDASFSTRVLVGKNPGVKLRGRDQQGRAVNLARVNKGILRHPLFGNRNYWFNTIVPPGWWDRPMQRGKGKAETAVKLAIDEMVVKFYMKRP